MRFHRTIYCDIPYLQATRLKARVDQWEGSADMVPRELLLYQFRYTGFLPMFPYIYSVQSFPWIAIVLLPTLLTLHS